MSDQGSIYSNGMCRVASAMPMLRLADPDTNADAIVELAAAAEADGCAVVVYPELALTGYALDDLFRQRVLIEASRAALLSVAQRTVDLGVVLLVGVPLEVDGLLFNCAAVIHRGQLKGIIPKSHLPGYSEFYEPRQFAAERDRMTDTVTIDGAEVPFGADLIFDVEGIEHLTIGVDICEDLWAPIPPSTYAALAGATVLANLSASNASVTKEWYRRSLVSGHSAKNLAAQIYTGMGYGDSTTDLAWDTHSIIAENGSTLVESERFHRGPQLVTADIDLERLIAERERLTTFRDSARDNAEKLRAMRRIRLERVVYPPTILRRHIPRYAYVPEDPAIRAEHAIEVLDIQTQGLARRLEATGLHRLVLGVSGGLDSALALIVAARVMDELELPRANLYCYSMPGYATGSHTRGIAMRLMKAMGVTAEEIDIRPSCGQMLRDLGHPYSNGEPVHDVTFENVQAGERTSHLFRIANMVGGLVVGTGDLSELALGWSTYGVGDHMSHYSVNASVPKTLVKHLIQTQVEITSLGVEANAALTEILVSPISPELIPGNSDDGSPTQLTEACVGPYALQDFFLYYCIRYGFSPSKLRFMARSTWLGEGGYTEAEIDKWLHEFLRRFFGNTQFKRSAIPNAPKVGNGGSLSPRGDWRAPSDSPPDLWVQALERAVKGIPGD